MSPFHLKCRKLRGSSRCAECGIYNGNRARRCRNKECDAQLFKGTDRPSTSGRSINGLDARKSSKSSFNDALVGGMQVRQQSQAATTDTNDSQKNSGASHTESSCFSFLQWLSSVTEKINQMMHFQFSGKPEPLVFHIPETFFECFHNRMSADEKKRLPNKTCLFVRRDSVPVGKFTVFTWHLYSLTRLYRIFNTPHIQLQITKYFSQCTDGSFVEKVGDSTQCPDGSLVETVGDTTELGSLAATTPHQGIAPGKLETFLKVGKNIQDPDRKTPFTIEWIPNILPLSKIGELRIKFEYGHKSK